MPYILSVDPGKVTGIAYGYYDQKKPYELHEVAAVPDGARGLHKWIEDCNYFNLIDKVVAEVFKPDGTAGGRETVSPQCEGVLIAHFDEIVWQKRSDKTWGGMGAKVVDERLKELGLWHTGKEVRWTDGRDVNDAIIHALQYLRSIKHMPTIRMIHKETPS